MEEFKLIQKSNNYGYTYEGVMKTVNRENDLIKWEIISAFPYFEQEYAYFKKKIDKKLPTDVVLASYLREVRRIAQFFSKEHEDVEMQKKYAFIITLNFYEFMTQLFKDVDYNSETDNFTITAKDSQKLNREDWVELYQKLPSYIMGAYKSKDIGKVMNGVESLFRLSTNIAW